MTGVLISRGLYPRDLLAETAAFIGRVQDPDGRIPWFPSGHADPWNHTEAAMGLTVAGAYGAAERAYRWLAESQLTDGSWWAAYGGEVSDAHWFRDTNFTAYIATGVWHHYLVTGDRRFLAELWPIVTRAIEFVLDRQTDHGDIHWAVDARDRPMEDALLAGCSSIYKSLECAWSIAAELDTPRPDWLDARRALGEALRERPERFDRSWSSKGRYSMDWFYPVLAGALPQPRARERLAARWDEFVRDEMGCLCVADEPWVTVAESCELAMALLRAGEPRRATQLYSWQHQWRLASGEYWTGYQYELDLYWPRERPTWTAGAILLAADALTGHTAAADLFTRVSLEEQPAERAPLGQGAALQARKL